MMPRTGPKHSWVWYHDPGLTLSRSPGDQSVPSLFSFRGLTSHFSPLSSCVNPRMSLSDGGSMIPFMVVEISVPGPTLRVSTASISWFMNRFELPTLPTTMTSDDAEHFCPAWPKADL